MARQAGRRALVTGASAGLGEAIATELVRSGARVLICSRDAKHLAAARGRMESAVRDRGLYPGVDGWQPPAACVADVSDEAAAERLARAARDELGGVDILVCNAGGPPPGDFSELSDGDWYAAFDLIVLSVIRLVRACLPQLRESKAGRIAMVTSLSGLRPIRRLLLSNSLRPAVMGLARHLARELGEDGILVNAIAPGFFDTERSREVQESIAQSKGIGLEQVQRERQAGVPLGRYGEPLELGRLASFLTSAENSYLTGQTLVIDGGLLVSD